ncbi:hypothetical protein EAE96_011291 [Botrytis aclada]|nr:hypothetical protein EAE96_011291 [Botrytis aclada]
MELIFSEIILILDSFREGPSMYPHNHSASDPDAQPIRAYFTITHTSDVNTEALPTHNRISFVSGIDAQHPSVLFEAGLGMNSRLPAFTTIICKFKRLFKSVFLIFIITYTNMLGL